MNLLTLFLAHVGLLATLGTLTAVTIAVKVRRSPRHP